MVVVNQISVSFLVYSLTIPALIAPAFGVFLYLKTKKLSSFYLLLLCIVFSTYAILDLGSWFPNPAISLGTWSVLDIFSTSFFILSFWFLYTFVKERDLPMWLKVLTASALVPTLVITASSINLNLFFGPSVSGLENQSVTNYNSILDFFFIFVVMVFSAVEYFKAKDPLSKKKMALSGIGIVVFLFVFCIVLTISNFIIAINFLGLGANAYVYTIDLYSLFGMPIFLTFLGYLIAKYQVFDIKLIKSVAYMVALMVLLFVGLFFA